MKKFFLIACMFALAVTVSQAQIKGISQTASGSSVTGNGLYLDTVTNTGVKIIGILAPSVTTAVTVQFSAIKISGTVAGTIIPVCSNDGIAWFANGAGTFTATDVALQGGVFSVPIGYRYYGIRWTGTGTMSASIKATLHKY